MTEDKILDGEQLVATFKACREDDPSVICEVRYYIGKIVVETENAEHEFSIDEIIERAYFSEQEGLSKSGEVSH